MPFPRLSDFEWVSASSFEDASPKEADLNAGPAVTNLSHELKGEEVRVGPVTLYICRPLDRALDDYPKAILVVHDRNGYESGRHRQLVDVLATQGWLSILPVLNPGESTKDAWLEEVRMCFEDYLLTWIQNRGVVHMQILAMGVGAVTAALASQAAVQRLAPVGEFEAPMVVGCAMVHPEVWTLNIRNVETLQKVFGTMDYPKLIIPARGDSEDVREGGILDQCSTARGNPVEFVEFNSMDHGFFSQGDASIPQIAASVEWAMALVCDFFHRVFSGPLPDPPDC